MTSQPKHENETGFSILEAMIAIAILAMAMMPLLVLQGQFVRAVDGFDRASARIEVQDASLNYLKTVNFTRFPSGETNIGDFVLKWDTQMFQEARMTRGVNGISGRFEVTLYSVEAKIFQNDVEKKSFIINGLGWRPVRPYVE